MPTPGNNPSTWTVGNYPELLQPIVGAIFWNIQSGRSPQEATEFARLNRDFGTVPRSYIDAASIIAQRLYSASSTARAASAMQPGAAVGAGLFPDIGPYTMLGARVTIETTLDDGSKDSFSIIVNAAASASVESILKQALEYVSGNVLNEWKRKYRVAKLDEASVSQISGIPWDNAVLVIGPQL